MTAPTYPHETSWTIERGESSHDVLVEYGVEERACAASGMFGPPEDYDPGSCWVFCINPVACWGAEHETLTLTDSEMDKIHDWLAENHEEDGNGSFYD